MRVELRLSKESVQQGPFRSAGSPPASLFFWPIMKSWENGPFRAPDLEFPPACGPCTGSIRSDIWKRGRKVNGRVLNQIYCTGCSGVGRSHPCLASGPGNAEARTGAAQREFLGQQLPPAWCIPHSSGGRCVWRDSLILAAVPLTNTWRFFIMTLLVISECKQLQ